MNRSPVFFRFHAWLSLGFTALAGCASGQFPTLTIYETPNAFVRLEADRQIDQTSGHSHPASISPEQIAAILHGVIVEEPFTRVPLYDDLSIPRRHRAFNEKDVEFWAPLFSIALSKATPEEVVTFYRTRKLSGVNREVTSGGLFVRGEHLHLVLSNYQSETHYAADFGVAETTDDRLTPMLSLSPQRGKLLFEPAEALRDPAPTGLKRLAYWDRRELVLLYRQLAPFPLSTESSHSQLPVTTEPDRSPAR